METKNKASRPERFSNLLPGNVRTGRLFQTTFRTMLCLISCLLLTAVSAQTSISLAFTALNNQAFIPLDSIRVINLTHPGDTILYYPDTTLMLTYVTAVPDNNYTTENQLVLKLTGANPYGDRTELTLSVPAAGQAAVIIRDATGMQITQWCGQLAEGMHTLTVKGGIAGIYFLHVQTGGASISLPLVCTGSAGSAAPEIRLNSGFSTPATISKNSLILNDFWFCPGDELRCIGFADSLESAFNIAPQASAEYAFQFAFAIPCPGADSVLYEGQWYHTVQIFSQCWMAQNLNVGVKINAPAAQTNNGIIEKYCLSNNANSCLTYGGVYKWDEMMQYTAQAGAQGICPAGWHIPSDHDFQILAGAVDSYYPIGHPVWSSVGNVGNDCGYNLKSVSGWNNNGNGCNMYGFNVIPGGFWYYTGNWAGGSLYTVFFSSTMTSAQDALTYGLSWMWNDIGREPREKANGMPVRCIKD